MTGVSQSQTQEEKEGAHTQTHTHTHTKTSTEEEEEQRNDSKGSKEGAHTQPAKKQITLMSFLKKNPAVAVGRGKGMVGGRRLAAERKEANVYI
jgi:hypothetical protein